MYENHPAKLSLPKQLIFGLYFILKAAPKAWEVPHKIYCKSQITTCHLPSESFWYCNPLLIS